MPLFRSAQRYSDTSPTDVAAHSTIGVALLRAGRCEEALGELEFAARLSESDEDPNRVPAAYLWFLMAIAHGKSGSVAEARRWQDKAQQWVEQHADSQQLSSWTRQLTIKILAAESRQILGQVANVTD